MSPEITPHTPENFARSNCPQCGYELDLSPPGPDILGVMASREGVEVSQSLAESAPTVQIPPTVLERIERQASELSDGIDDPKLREELRQRAYQYLLDRITQTRLGAAIVLEEQMDSLS